MNQAMYEKYKRAVHIKWLLESVQTALESDHEYPLRMSEMIATCLQITETHMDTLIEGVAPQ